MEGLSELLCNGLGEIMSQNRHCHLLGPEQPLPEDSNLKGDVTIDTVHELTLMWSPREESLVDTLPEPSHGEYPVNIGTLTGKAITVCVSATHSVEHMKLQIQKKEGIPKDQQRLIYGGKPLEDDRQMGDYGIKPHGFVLLVFRLRGGGIPTYRFNSELIAPKFNHDFTHKSDDGCRFVRGGKPYHRPLGWYRFALKVVDKFDDNVWLGPDGIREWSAPGEWPVSYHATAACDGKKIAHEGYRLSKCTQSGSGVGIYSTPSLKIAEKYAPTFMHKGKRFQMILQNRVNPTTLKTVKVDGGSEVDEYWVSPNQDDIRAYGILVRCVDEPNYFATRQLRSLARNVKSRLPFFPAKLAATASPRLKCKESESNGIPEIRKACVPNNNGSEVANGGFVRK